MRILLVLLICDSFRVSLGGAPSFKPSTAPISKSPVTKAPASKAPATKAPATKAPVPISSSAPVTATKAPASKAPATKAPASKAPVPISSSAPVTASPQALVKPSSKPSFKPLSKPSSKPSSKPTGVPSRLPTATVTAICELADAASTDWNYYELPVGQKSIWSCTGSAALGYIPGSDICSWSYVTCNAGKTDVVAIEEEVLVGSQIYAIPTSIAGLSSLTKLVLKSSFSNYTYYPSDMVSNIAGLTSLVYLDLSYTSLTFTVPTFLSSMSALQYLNLAGNLLTSSIPSFIGEILILSYLDLSDNHLTSTIPDLTNMNNLAYLLLGGNSISGTVPSYLGTLSYLNYLNISVDYFSGSLPSSLCTSPALTFLDIRNTYQNSPSIVPLCYPACLDATSGLEFVYSHPGDGTEAAGLPFECGSPTFSPTKKPVSKAPSSKAPASAAPIKSSAPVSKAPSTKAPASAAPRR